MSLTEIIIAAITIEYANSAIDLLSNNSPAPVGF
jgi:hypothetical protein